MVFDARVGRRQLAFGVSGLLYNSDVLLYDRQTESLWSQIKKEAVTGPMKGRRLRTLPVTHTTWRDWCTQHPTTRVLSTDIGHARDYSRDPCGGYASERELYFPVSASSNRYHPKERVLGLALGGEAKAYPFAELSRGGRTEVLDRIGGGDVVIRFDAVNQSATAHDGDGGQLPAVNGDWFAWYAFHPDTAVFTAKARR